MTRKALVVWRKNPINPRKPAKSIRTICEVLRELYRDAEARDDGLSMARLDECHDMAKRMQKKLEEYNRREPYTVVGGVKERCSK
jgi:hypothetical protein